MISSWSFVIPWDPFTNPKHHGSHLLPIGDVYSQVDITKASRADLSDEAIFAPDDELTAGGGWGGGHARLFLVRHLKARRDQAARAAQEAGRACWLCVFVILSLAPAADPAGKARSARSTGSWLRSLWGGDPDSREARERPNAWPRLPCASETGRWGEVGPGAGWRGPRKVLVWERAWRPSCAFQLGWPAQRPLPPSYQLAAQLNLPLPADLRTKHRRADSHHSHHPHPLHIALLAFNPIWPEWMSNSSMTLIKRVPITHSLQARMTHLHFSDRQRRTIWCSSRSSAGQETRRKGKQKSESRVGTNPPPQQKLCVWSNNFLKSPTEYGNETLFSSSVIVVLRLSYILQRPVADTNWPTTKLKNEHFPCFIFIVKTFMLKEFKAFYVSAVLSLQFQARGWWGSSVTQYHPDTKSS